MLNSPPESHKPAHARPLRSLYICYFPITEPLVQTQVVAYLQGLAAHGHTVHLLTYETEAMTAAQKRVWRKKLKEQGIVWHSLRYHKRPTLPATMYDVLCGVLVGMRIVRRYHLDAIHARAHVSAAMGLMLKKLLGVRLIFDIRGLVAEEFEDAGIWTRDGLPFRITKATEKICLNASDGFVVLTERVRKVLFTTEEQTPSQDGNKAQGYRVAIGDQSMPLQVIPCCADLSQIEAQSEDRESMRRELGLDDKRVMVYVGKFGGWYMQSEMVDFFAEARQVIPDLHFLVLTQSDPAMIESEFARREIPASEYTITRSAPERVGSYLAAAEFAISFIAAFPSKIASSPTKLGEYLAAGLPTICNPGVGDVDLIIDEYRVGVTVPEFDAESYRAAAHEILSLLEDETVRERCRQAAHGTSSLQEIGVPRYNALYEQVAQQL